MLKIEKKYKYYTILGGTWYKNRSIQVISDRLQKAYAIRRKHFRGVWDSWIKKGSCVGGQFWGHERIRITGKTKKKKWEKRICIWSFSDNGYSRDVVGPNDFEKIVKTTTDLDAPLLITAPNLQSPEAKNWVEKRLKNQVPVIPQRQDLADEYNRMEIRSDHIGHVISIYEAILERHFYDKHHETIFQRKYGLETLVIAQIGDACYHLTYEPGHEGGLKLFKGNIIKEVL